MKKKISDHTWIKVLDDGRAFTLSNKRDSGLDTILGRLRSGIGSICRQPSAGKR